jgi:hypothetical protein
MDSQVAARQFFELVTAGMALEAIRWSRPAPTKDEMKQRVREAIDCFLNGYASKQTSLDFD